MRVCRFEVLTLGVIPYYIIFCSYSFFLFSCPSSHHHSSPIQSVYVKGYICLIIQPRMFYRSGWLRCVFRNSVWSFVFVFWAYPVLVCVWMVDVLSVWLFISIWLCLSGLPFELVTLGVILYILFILYYTLLSFSDLILPLLLFSSSFLFRSSHLIHSIRVGVYCWILIFWIRLVIG